MDANALGADVHNVNILTIIASESYDNFAKGLQSEIAEAVADRPKKLLLNCSKERSLKISMATNKSLMKILPLLFMKASLRMAM